MIAIFYSYETERRLEIAFLVRRNCKKGREYLLSFIYAKIILASYWYNICKSRHKQIVEINTLFICKTPYAEFTNICKHKELLQTGGRYNWEK